MNKHLLLLCGILPFSLSGMSYERFCNRFFTENMTFESAIEYLDDANWKDSYDYFMFKALASTYLQRKTTPTYKQMKKELDEYQNNLPADMAHENKVNVKQACETMKKAVDAWDTRNYKNVFKYMQPEQKSLRALLGDLGVQELIISKDKNQ